MPWYIFVKFLIDILVNPPSPLLPLEGEGKGGEIASLCSQ